LLSQSGHIAELPHGCLTRGFRRHSAGEKLLGCLRPMKCHLFIQFIEEPPAPQENRELPHETGEGIHLASCGSLKTRPIAAIISSYCDNSMPNCRRPAAVSV